jgi:hypothetical protein
VSLKGHTAINRTIATGQKEVDDGQGLEDRPGGGDGVRLLGGDG